MRIIVNFINNTDKEKAQSFIYIYEDDCGIEPHQPFVEFNSLYEALRHNKNATVMRYPSKNDKMW